jgi:hypothetical protein
MNTVRRGGDRPSCGLHFLRSRAVAAERLDADARTLLWTVAATVLVTQVWALIVWPGYLDVHLIKPAWLTVFCLGAGTLVWLWRRSLYRKGLRGFHMVLALLAVCIVWMLPQLIYMAAHAEPHDAQRCVRAAFCHEHATAANCIDIDCVRRAFAGPDARSSSTGDFPSVARSVPFTKRNVFQCRSGGILHGSQLLPGWNPSPLPTRCGMGILRVKALSPA